jgi:hypothetical protein
MDLEAIQSWIAIYLEPMHYMGRMKVIRGVRMPRDTAEISKADKV